MFKLVFNAQYKIVIHLLYLLTYLVPLALVLALEATCLALAMALKMQTSSNRRANIQQMHSKYTCTTRSLIARCLLDDCLIV